MSEVTREAIVDSFEVFTPGGGMRWLRTARGDRLQQRYVSNRRGEVWIDVPLVDEAADLSREMEKETA